MDSTPRTDDLLSRHGAFLRRLAGELTRCDADAEDLVQSTWAEALRRPPLSWRSPRGWLAQVARRLAGKRARSDGRRTRREVQAARHERVEADLDLSLILGELSQALAKLEPKLRRVVVARHFEGRELRTIAEGEGVAISTAKERLARAHRELRQALDGGAGRERWMGALGPLLARPAAPVLLSPVLPAAAGALAMTATLKIASVAGLAGLLALGLSNLGGEPAQALEPSAELGSKPEPVAANPLGSTGEGQRTAVTAAPVDELSAEAEPAVALPLAGVDVLVTDSFGVPAAYVEVYAAPEGLPLNLVGDTNGKGKLAVRWRSGSATRLVVGVRADGRWLGGLRRFDLGLGQTRQLELAVHPDLLPARDSGFVRTQVTISQLREMTARLKSDLRQHEARVEEPKEPRRPGPMRPEPKVDEAGGALTFSAYSPAKGDKKTLNVIARGYSMKKGEGGEGGIMGILRDAYGQPIADVEVALKRKGRKPEAQAWNVLVEGPVLKRTNREGVFELDLGEGTYELKVPSKGDVQIKVDVHVNASGTTSWQGVLDLGARLWGRAKVAPTQDEEKIPRPVIAAVAPRPDGLWIGVTKASKSGDFSIPFCPAQTLDVDFTVAGSSDLPLLHVEGARTDAADWTVFLQPDTLSEVSFLPLDTGQTTAAASELRVWDRRTGRGWSGKAKGRQGDPVSLKIAPGDWDLQVRPRGLGDVPATSFSVLDSRPVDLGAVQMPSIGWLDLPRGEAGASWRVERTGDGVLLFQGALPETADPVAYSLELPPGSYRVTPPEQDSEPRTLAVQAGHRANW